MVRTCPTWDQFETDLPYAWCWRHGEPGTHRARGPGHHPRGQPRPPSHRHKEESGGLRLTHARLRGCAAHFDVTAAVLHRPGRAGCASSGATGAAAPCVADTGVAVPLAVAPADAPRSRGPRAAQEGRRVSLVRPCQNVTFRTVLTCVSVAFVYSKRSQ